MSRRYDTALHRRLRRQVAAHVAAGGVICWRCEKEIEPGTPWDLGHDDEDPDQYRGPEHAECNRSAGGVKRHVKPVESRLGSRSRVW